MAIIEDGREWATKETIDPEQVSGGLTAAAQLELSKSYLNDMIKKMTLTPAQMGTSYRSGRSSSQYDPYSNQYSPYNPYNPANIWNSFAGQKYPPAATTKVPLTGYAKQKAEETVSASKVVAVRKEWCKFPSLQRPYTGNKHIMGCCVCKTKTPANMPWWKPFRIMKVTGLLKKDFPYKDMYSTSRLDENSHSYEKRDYYFAVCSEECEHFIYLALLEV